MFICLFVCLFVCLFCFNQCGIPTGRCPESFANIQLDLARVFTIRKLDWHDREGEKGTGEGKES